MRHDHSAHRRCRPMWGRRWLHRSWRHGRGRRYGVARLITTGCWCYWNLHRRGLHCRHYHFGLGVNRDWNLIFGSSFFRLNWRINDCGRRRRLRRDGNCGRRTGHRLRCNESRCRLGSFHRSDRRSTGSNCRRFGNAARRTRRHSRRRSHGLARRRCLRGAWTRRNDGLGSLLCDRLQHVSGFGDMRQVDLRLELFRLRARGTAAGAAGLSMLSVIFLDELRLIHFDGAGVRLLFRDSDLQQQIENHFAFDFEFPRQVVNSNLLLHSALFPPYCPVRLRAHSILTPWYVDPRLDRAPGFPKLHAGSLGTADP